MSAKHNRKDAQPIRNALQALRTSAGYDNTGRAAWISQTPRNYSMSRAQFLETTSKFIMQNPRFMNLLNNPTLQNQLKQFLPTHHPLRKQIEQQQVQQRSQAIPTLDPANPQAIQISMMNGVGLAAMQAEMLAGVLENMNLTSLEENDVENLTHATVEHDAALTGNEHQQTSLLEHSMTLTPGAEHTAEQETVSQFSEMTEGLGAEVSKQVTALALDSIAPGTGALGAATLDVSESASAGSCPTPSPFN